MKCTEKKNNFTWHDINKMKKPITFIIGKSADLHYLKNIKYLLDEYSSDSKDVKKCNLLKKNNCQTSIKAFHIKNVFIFVHEEIITLEFRDQ